MFGSLEVVERKGVQVFENNRGGASIIGKDDIGFMRVGIRINIAPQVALILERECDGFNIGQCVKEEDEQGVDVSVC